LAVTPYGAGDGGFEAVGQLAQLTECAYALTKLLNGLHEERFWHKQSGGKFVGFSFYCVLRSKVSDGVVELAFEEKALVEIEMSEFVSQREFDSSAPSSRSDVCVVNDERVDFAKVLYSSVKSRPELARCKFYLLLPSDAKRVNREPPHIQGPENALSMMFDLCLNHLAPASS
jgi:hypothetical protein